MQQFWLWLAQRRTWVQALATLATNSYLTRYLTKGIPCASLNCYACPAAAFACPIGSLQHFVGRREIPLYVLGMIGLTGTLIGRASCGWFCPFGWLQDLLHKIPLPKLELPNRLNWTRYLILGALVIAAPLATREPWFCKLCPTGMLEAGILLPLFSTDIRSLIGTLYWLKLGILATLLAWMTLTRRPFCRWICPLGALWSPLNPVSAFRLQIERTQCSECGHCQEICPVDICVYEEPNAAACIRCLACARACPQDCISVASLSWRQSA